MITFDRIERLNGELTVPSDKSITHRSFLFSGMAEGVSRVYAPLMSRDTIATMNSMKAVGVTFEPADNGFIITSSGFRGFKEPSDVINCDNSGTTARLLTGVLAPRGFYAVLTGDASLRRRPMGRVIKPLTAMGATITARDGGKLLPMTIHPSRMQAANLTAETKSAQVKSCIILAALQADGESRYVEKVATRDHTERLLADFGVHLGREGDAIIIPGNQTLKATEMLVPGDFSSAAFFLAAPFIFENSEITVHDVGLNPTRTGLVDAIATLGGKLDVTYTKKDGEPIGSVTAKSAQLTGGVIKGDIIANIIDEIPMIATLGLFAANPVEIRDAEELRVKESDRIAATAYNLRQLGAEVEEYPDGLKVYPLKKLAEKAELKSFDDHRIAMIAIMLCKKFGSSVSVDEIEAIDVSFPDFVERLSTVEVR